MAKAAIQSTNGKINWHLTYKNLTPGMTLEHKLRQKIGKLETNLAHFPTDAMHLLVRLEHLRKKASFTAALTMRLPSNILHSQKSSPDPVAALDMAVKAMLREISSLKASLRREKHWRWRGRGNNQEAEFQRAP